MPVYTKLWVQISRPKKGRKGGGERREGKERKEKSLELAGFTLTCCVVSGWQVYLSLCSLLWKVETVYTHLTAVGGFKEIVDPVLCKL